MLMSVDCNRPDGNNRTSDRKSAIAPCFLIDTKLTKPYEGKFRSNEAYDIPSFGNS